jgi:ketosteroid isomerase-like protein
MRPLLLIAACLGLLAGLAHADEKLSLDALRQQVTDTERAFADSMARRDHAAFSRFLADDAVFVSGATALHGKEQVANGWKRFYEKPAAPFSWTPDNVIVLDSGGLAFSSGPVFNAEGQKGSDVCDCTKP